MTYTDEVAFTEMTGEKGPKIQIQLDGEHLDLSTLVQVVQSFAKILSRVDVAISGKKSLVWEVKSLSKSSPALIEAVPRPRNRGVDVSDKVARHATNGLFALESGTTPEFFDGKALDGVSQISRNRANERITLFRVTYLFDGLKQAEASLSGLAGEYVKSIMAPRFSEIGSVEGRLETATIHNQDALVVYDNITGQKVSCIAQSREQLDGYTKEIPLGSRVLVTGLVSTNSVGTPLNVRVDSIRTLRGAGELPQATDILGLYSDLEISSSDFGEYLRGDLD